ncbi:MAG: hydroxymethylglutaryl-CoA reductase, degradative [Nitrosopumilus sp.]|nr:hydroxymethylglutaryl-CoA reductase, degradative [Nitrosopumilus sp.]MDA7953373.1 hydroxymethylglutaryl-CoA reductase, degradative [Nitrosopumilus sp.]MDA7958379.1 hydroxymethylglutaryl-CoA reductase, degradative [Nitrosopumilus sp.]MDA7999139.1 hydroxymethylglutaryl-CoA reductase, degradative [Nitrosopumilus sp.]
MSAMPGFHKRTPAERLEAAARLAGLSAEDRDAISGGGIDGAAASRMTENSVGVFSLPLGIATNFVVNGRDVLVPMAIEEPSVVAAASRGAKAARPLGGFTASAGPPHVTGQVQVVGAAAGSEGAVLAARDEILAAANSVSRTLAGSGRGARDVACRWVGAASCRMLLAELTVDAGDAMGANVTNSMCEAVSPIIERATGGRAVMRILSNYSEVRIARASAAFEAGGTGGPDVVRDMVLAYELAAADTYRAVTHNKGVMNGVAAVACAAGQDTRAIEAAAGAYASRSGRYGPLTEWRVGDGGRLEGSIELPLAVGVVGGVAGVHPGARACIRMTGARTSGELACIIASAGLAQNYAALRALAAEGIQKGHMRLHARNVAAAAGVPPGDVERVAEEMAAAGDISAESARRIAGP